MSPKRDADFRLKLAAGFQREAEEDFRLSRWRSCVDNAQMTVENSVKAILAMRGPVPRVHQLEAVLSKLLRDSRLKNLNEDLSSLREIGQQLGFEAHIRTDYGDEARYQTPWELFGEDSAKEALGLAQKATDLASRIIEKWPQSRKR
jgi:HEPN domain-containing protein